MHTVFLALGSNVGNKIENIERATKFLETKIGNLKRAPLYETKPVGFLEQDDFVNTAIVGETELQPRELFVFVKRIEKKLGRIKRFRFGPREIDIDILLYDDLVYKDDDVQIPHISLHERDFVLQPIVDLSPKTMHPILHKTMEELLKNLPNNSHSVLQKISKVR